MNKTVLLHDRKRRAAHCVASFSLLSGEGGTPFGDRGTQVLSRGRDTPVIG